MNPPRVVLKPGREKSLRHRHPWVFSGAIEKVEGDPESGATVSVVARDGAFLAWAAYCPSSQIRARVWSFDAGEAVNYALVANGRVTGVVVGELTEGEAGSILVA